MFLDLLIVIVLALAIYAGFQRGLLPPLLSELAFIIALILLLRGPLAFLPRLVTQIGLVHVLVALLLAALAGMAGGRLGRMLQRMPVVRGVDGFFGIFVHTLVAVVVLYVLVSALVAMDRAFDPLAKQATLTAAQADQLQKSLGSNSLTSLFVDRHETNRLARDSHTKQGALIDNFPQLNQLQSNYLGFVRPQLRGSRLAPLILRIGSRLPLVSHLGTGSIPRTK